MTGDGTKEKPVKTVLQVSTAEKLLNFIMKTCYFCIFKGGIMLLFNKDMLTVSMLLSIKYNGLVMYAT